MVQPHIEKDKSGSYWTGTAQLVLFVSAITVLSGVSFLYKSVEIRRPIVLLAGVVLSLLNFENSSKVSITQIIVLIYIIEMLFNQFSGRFVHIQSFSIHLSLVAMVPLTVSFLCSKFQQLKDSSTETNVLFVSWIIVFAVVILHMLFLFLLLDNIYSYGYEHNFAVLANMCLYFLVFVFSYERLKNIGLRKITAIVLGAFLIVVTVKGL